MKAIIALIAVLFFLSFLAFPSFAANVGDVVINEVFANPSGSSAEETEFIEFFNKGSEPIDVSGWKISDKVKTYIIVNTIIPASGFVAFRKGISGIQLNNSDEEVTLKDLSDQTVDSMSYDITIEDKSWSRVPDGTGAFINNIDPTESIANSVPTPTLSPTPSSTPTPTRTPTPTSVSTSTKTPTPAPTKTPTPTLTPTKTPTSAPNTPTSKPSVMPTSKLLPTSVLGESTESGEIVSPTDTQSPNENTLISNKSKNANNNWLQKFFIGIGAILLIGCAILSFRFYIKNKEQDSEIL